MALAQVSKNKVVNEMELMDEWLNKMAEEVSDANRVTKTAMRKARDDTKLAENRLTKLKELKTQLKEVKDDLADESHLCENLEKMGIIRRNGVPPACVRGTLQTTSAYFTGRVVTKLPSVSYVRECRFVLQILNDLLGAYKLGMNATWKQLCTDGTTRRQIGFQSLLIGLLTKKGFESVIVPSCIFMDDETSEMQVKGIEDKVSIVRKL